MRTLLLRRAAYAVIQLFGASMIIFVIVRLLPGDPATSTLGATAGPEQIQALRERLGLTKSIPEQYWIWLRDILHGNLGTSSVTSRPVLDDVADRLPATLELVTLTLFLSVVVLIPLGIVTARRPRSIYSKALDKGIFGYGMLAGATADFWLALLLIFAFYSELHWAAAPLGRLDIAIAPPNRVTGLYVIDSVVAGNWAAFRSSLEHLALPVITLTFVYGAAILKITRQTMLHMLDSEFIEQARASGLPERTQLRMAFKNALPPILTLVGITYGYIIGGAVLVETVFSWGGLGQYAVQSIGNADYAAIQGFVLIATSIAIVVYLVIDVLHYVIDPRIRA
jgi:ABC-type dipeptide/oligopeptide/nickel transport system permease component